jgi:O-antigen/teichoic acid export membrane protein
MAASTLAWPFGRPRRSSAAVIPALVDRDAIVTIFVRLTIVAGGLLSSVLTARWLSPSGRGQYFLVVTLAQMLAQFGNLGLQSSNTYLVARDRSLLAPLLVNSFWISVVVGGLGSAAVIMLGFGATGGYIWFAAVLAPATLFYMLGTNLLVGLKRIGAFNMFQLASNYGVLLCLACAAAFGAGPSGFVAASAGGWVVVALVLAVILGRGTTRRLSFDSAVFSDGFRFALKAYVATACGFLVVRSNVFLLSALQGAEQVGYYSVASQIADVMGILPQSMALVLFPTLIMAKEGQFTATLRSMAVVGLLLAAGCGMVALLADPFVRTVFGEKFLQTVPLLRWMLPGVFFLGLTSVLSQYLAASGFPLSLVAVWIGGSVAAAGFGWLLIPGSAGVGAAMALSLSHTLIFFAVLTLSVFHARRAASHAGLCVLVPEGAAS